MMYTVGVPITDGTYLVIRDAEVVGLNTDRIITVNDSCYCNVQIDCGRTHRTYMGAKIAAVVEVCGCAGGCLITKYCYGM